jgi:Creatinine amidohydrolase
MGERMNDIRRLVRSGCLLLLPFLILSVATFAHSQERPSIFLDELTWTELRDEIATGKTTIIVPIGGTEQSGPAMALGKHNRRVKLLSERIAVSLGNAIVAPVIAYVPEGNLSPPSGHMRFPGTISVPEAAFDSSTRPGASNCTASKTSSSWAITAVTKLTKGTWRTNSTANGPRRMCVRTRLRNTTTQRKSSLSRF